MLFRRSCHASVHRLLRIASIASLVFLTGCLPGSLRVDGVPDLAAGSRTHASYLTLSVIADPESEHPAATEDLEELADLLRATDLFGEVRVGAVGTGDDADLRVLAKESLSFYRCGMPLLLSMYTLGLVPTNAPLSRTYDFAFEVPEGGQRLRLAKTYSTEEKFGLWAVPIRLSKRWKRSSAEAEAELWARHLRIDLLHHLPRLEAMAAPRCNATADPSVDAATDNR